MKKYLQGILRLSFIATPFLAVAGTDNCTSTGSGNFSNPAIWSCGHVPDKDDNVTVGHDITLDIDFAGGGAIKGTWTINSGKTLSSAGKNLEVSSTGRLTANGNMQLGDLSFKNGSSVTIAASSAITVSGNLTNNNNSNNVNINGLINVSGNFTNGTNAVVSGSGEIRVSGNVSNAASGTIFGCTGPGCNCSNCTLNPVTLPVEFVKFTATLTEEKTVKLSWITASEQNNDYFTIEKSANGLIFSETGRQKGAGNSSDEKIYEFTDSHPSRGVSYYRIKQTDTDGKFDFSEVVAVSYEEKADGSCVLKVIPNPCPGKCNVALSDCKEMEKAEIIVEVVDALGNKIRKHIPYRNSDGSFSFYLDETNALAPGIYIVNAASEKEKYSKKVIVK